MNWVALYDSLQVNSTPWPGYEFVPIPTEPVIDEFEREHRFALPRSYRDFVARFGAGQLSGLWSIASPMQIEHQFELAKYNSVRHGLPEDRLLVSYGSREDTDTFFFFADDGDYYYGWKLGEITNPKFSEYAIYKFGYPDRLPRVHDSFDLLVRFVLTPRPRWDPEPTFARCYR